MTPYQRDILEVLAGSSTVDAVAARYGLEVADVEAERGRMVATLATSMQASRSPSRWRTAALVAGAVIVAGIAVPSSAWAQLVTFTPNTAAVAADVNGNFAQLKTWLEQKVGAVGTANITSTGTLNGINIRVKDGNDGSVSCDTYCSGTYAGFSGTCLGAKTTAGAFLSDCSYTPGLLSPGHQHTCICATY